jgi:hypothetical protein
MDKMIALHPAAVVPVTGPASRDVERDLVLTRDYLAFLRAAMGRAVKDFEPFDDATQNRLVTLSLSCPRSSKPIAPTRTVRIC